MSRRLLCNTSIFSCALMLCFITVPAHATNIAWKAASTGSWTVATNWNPAQVPGINDVAIITVAGTYDVNINSNVSVNAISLGSSAHLKVNSVTLTTTTGITTGASSVLELNSATLSGGGVSLHGQLSSSGTSSVNVALSTATSSIITVGAGSLTVANGFTNLGLLSYPATGTRSLFVTNGTFTNAASGTVSCATTGSLVATLDNQGSITSTGPQGFLNLGKSGATSTNSGAISATGGAYLILNGSGDTFNTSGNLSADALSILRVGGGVFHHTGGTISGSGYFELINTTSATFASNPTTAVLYLAGHGIVFPSSLVNGSAQQVILGTGSDVTAPQLTNQVGYSLRVDEGVDALHVATFFNLGTLVSPRYFLLDGNLNCGPLSNIEFGIGGPSIYWYDRIVVTGAAQLGGSIFFHPEGVFSPVVGDYFDVLSSPARIGLFDTLNGWDLGNDKYLVVDPLVTAADNRPYTVRAVRQKWIPLAPTGTPPPSRYGHTAVYAPASDRMIVFGGETAGSGAASDLWVLDHAAGFNATPHWIQMTPTGTAPDPRAFHSAVYDVVNNRMIVYGGQNDNPGFYGDVWILTNADGLSGTPAWEKFPDLPSPSARSGHSAGYDPITNHMVVWGGEISCFGAYGDMWVLDHANGIGTTTGWSLWSVSGTPPPLRRDAAAAYDPNGNRLIVYGGKTPCQYGLSDASVLSNASGAPDVSNPTWNSLGAGASPALPGLNGASGTYDPLFDRMVVFGGLENDISTFRSSVFLLADTHGLAGWTELPLPTTRPEGRAFHSMVYSQPIHRWIVFGGNANGNVVNDVWALELEGDTPQVTGIGSGPTSPQNQRVLAFSASPSPNPCSHGTQFSVRALGDVDGNVAIYDAMGRRVVELFDGRMTAGEHRFEWKGNIASGIYFVAVQSGDRQDVRRVVVTR